MNKYQSHPHVPRWIEAMDGELLSSTELDVFDFIWWCKKHGCRTSNDRIGKHTHWSHATVQRAIQKLYRLDLVAIDSYAKRTRRVKVVPWPDRETWEKFKRRWDLVAPNAALSAPHIPRIERTPLTGGSILGKVEPPATGELISRGGHPPPNPPRGSGEEAQNWYQKKAKLHRDKLVKAGWNEERANSIALVKFPLAKF